MVFTCAATSTCPPTRTFKWVDAYGGLLAPQDAAGRRGGAGAGVDEGRGGFPRWQQRVRRRAVVPRGLHVRGYIDMSTNPHFQMG